MSKSGAQESYMNLSDLLPLTKNSRLSPNNFKLIDFGFKMDLINKILNDPRICLNSLQLINFLNYYFDETAGEDIDIGRSSGLSLCFPCIACSSKFSYEQTFHLHLERRAIIVKIFCSECKQMKTFYNKCKLFYHIYSHKANLLEPLYRQIQIEQIPIEKCRNPSSKHLDSLSFVFNSLGKIFSKQSADISNINLMINERFKLNEQDLTQIKLFLKRLQNNRLIVYKCCVCDALFLDQKDLKLHFIQSKKFDAEYTSNTASNRFYFKQLKEKYLKSRISDSNESSDGGRGEGVGGVDGDEDVALDLLNTFSIDKLQYATKCSQLVNLSLIELNFKFFSTNNLSRQSLICPECGLVFDHSLNKNYVELYKLHLKYDCLFMLRYDLDEYKCTFKECNYNSSTVNGILNHWCTQHLIKQHQCESCAKNGVESVFREKDVDKMETGLSINLISQINKHFFEKHRNEAINVSTKFMCQCEMTDMHDETKCQVYTNLKNCKSHLIDQINKSILSIDCYLCKSVVLNKDFVNHLKTEHTDEKFYVCPLCGPVRGQEPTLHVHVLRNHSSIAGFKSCFYNILSDRNHLNVYLCLNCRLFFTSDTKFCHNCWAPTQPNTTNYFSPVYLKFSVSKYVEKDAKQTQEPDVIVLKESQVFKIYDST